MEHKIEELKKVLEKYRSTDKEQAQKYLQELGTHDKEGRLTPDYYREG